MRLNQITIPSLDVPRSIEFYKKLGLKLIVHTHDAYARFELPEGESTFSIHKVDELPKGNGIIIYFEIENLDEYIEQLEAKEIATEKPQDQSWLWRESKLKDPDGNSIILFFAGKNRKNPPWRLEK
ncbi:MAG: VOC family protein [bacterium]|nr:VOC family protein [bacterium]